MSENPARIIEEYLNLVREKLPESIADDVISELETYMMETASELGENGQITIESAKKVVAQFGAPGEVADEYKFSMLPETIPKEDIPAEIKQEAVKEPVISEPEKPAPRVQGIDPTVSYSVFFMKSILLTLFWASLVSIIPLISVPYWAQGSMSIFIILPVICVALFLLVRTLYLKTKSTILWKRSYPDWSIFQTLVTLPENALPEAGANFNSIDIFLSFIGVLLFAPTIFQWNHPFGYLFGVPIAILFIARIKLTIGKFNEEKDPYENARLEFGINLSLMVLLESSIYFLFDSFNPWYYYTFLYWAAQYILTLVTIYGPILLFQLLIGAQNLWWRTEKQVSEEQISRIKTVRKIILRNAGVLLIKIIGWMVISDSIIIYSCLLFAPQELFVLYSSRVGSLIVSMIMSIGLVVGYTLIRYIRVRNFNSITFIGRRTRLEALVDSIVSIFLIGATTIFALGTLLPFNSGYMIVHFYPNFFPLSIHIGEIVIGMEFLLLLIIVIAFATRIQGNILEFKPDCKINAANKIRRSGKLMIVAVSFIAGGELVYYLSFIPTGYIAYSGMSLFYFFFMTIIAFIAFQVVSSEVKVRELSDMQESMKENDQSIPAGNNSHSTSIAN